MKNVKFTRTILFNTLISYLVLMVVFISIWICGMSWVTNVTRKQNQVIYGNLLEGISHNTDKDLMIAERAALNVATSATTAKMLTNFRENKKDILLIRDVRDNMADMMMNQNAIRSSMIYLINEDYIVASNTTGGTLTYYRTYVNELGIEYQAWLDFLGTIQQSGYYLMETSGTPVLYYAYLAPINFKKEAIVLMQINDSVISGLGFADRLENIGLEIIADNGTVIVSCEKEEDNQTISVKSADTGWSYTGYVENDDFDGTFRRITFWMISGVLVSAITCAIALYVSLRSHYLPIKTIVRNLSSVIENPDKTKDEYGYITNSLERLIIRQKQDSYELAQQGEKLKEVYLQYLFSGRGKPEDIKEKDLALFGLDFVEEGFYLAFFIPQKDWQYKKDGIYAENRKKIDGVYAGQRGEAKGYFLKEEKRETLQEQADQLQMGQIYLSTCHKGGVEIYAAGEEIEQLLRCQIQKTGIFSYEEYQAEKKQNRLMEEILACIEENYKNPDLSVESICQQLNRSVSGVNKQLKESGEEGILHYVSVRRVQEAKKLFQETKGTISAKEVMQMVGYTNLNTFIRVFKKYEGITPGEYCKMQQDAQQTR